MQSHGGNVSEISKKYGIGEHQIIDFSSNINPLGFPAAVHTVLKKEVDEIIHYPDTDSSELRDAIARYHGISQKNILIGNGSTELIYLIPRAFKPTRALIPLPTFSDYQRSLLSAGGQVHYLTLREHNHFRIKSDEVIALLPTVDIVWLCNPNNPTGTLLARGEIRKLITRADREGVMVVVDEAFMDFAGQASVIAETKRRENLIIIKSLTKLFGIPGLRVGYLVAHPRLIDILKGYKEPWTVNVFAQKVGIACLKDKRFRARTKKFIDQEKRYLFNALSGCKGLKPYPSSANFLLVKLERQGLSSGTLYEKLAQQGILVRDCRSFDGLGDRFIRVAVKKRKENMILVNALKKAVER